MKVDRHPVVWIAAVAMAATVTACGSSASVSSLNAPAGAANSANATSAAAAATTGAQPAAAKDGCPTAASVSGAAGIRLSTPQVTKQGETLMCSYPSANGILAISRQADAEYSPDTAKSALQSQAQALGLSSDAVKTVNGIGDAAYEFDQGDSTTLGIVSGTAYIAVIGAPNSTAAKAVAKLFVQ